MTAFHDRSTGLIHSTLVSPDGGMVNATHSTLEEAHAWGANVVEQSRKANPPAFEKGAERWEHKDNQGNYLGIAHAHTHMSDYQPFRLPQIEGKL